MKYLHTMVRVHDVDAALDFFCNKLGMIETRRTENEAGRFTLIFLVADEDQEQSAAERAPLPARRARNWNRGGRRN